MGEGSDAALHDAIVKLADARKFALGLPEAEEENHHAFPSFRIRGKIFATQPDDEHFHVMVDPDEIRAAAAESPECCAEMWWGKRLSAVRIELGKAPAPLVRELLSDAWRRKAPKALVREFDA
jgi:hypothetical protein